MTIYTSKRDRGSVCCVNVRVRVCGGDVGSAHNKLYT